MSGRAWKTREQIMKINRGSCTFPARSLQTLALLASFFLNLTSPLRDIPSCQSLALILAPSTARYVNHSPITPPSWS
jgi:hypothetical protein